MKPNWLPDIIPIDGEWDETLKRLYKVFESDFIQGHPTLDGMPVWWDNRKIDGEYEEGFWHLITKKDNPSAEERLFDNRRAERLSWCAPILLNSTDSAVKIWDYKEGQRKIRTYVWLEQLDYVVILERRKIRNGKTVAVLITAYYVEGESTKRTLGRKYKNRIT